MLPGGVEAAQVVVAQAAPDDEHALVPQGRERAPDGEVGVHVVVAPDGELKHWHVGLGVDGLERRERAMVEAAPVVGRGREARAAQQFLHAAGDPGRARRRVFDLVGERGEARVVVDHRRPWGRHHCEVALLPVARDHQHGLRGRAHLAGHVTERGLEVVEHTRHLFFEPRPGAAAVRDEVGRESPGCVFYHRTAFVIPKFVITTVRAKKLGPVAPQFLEQLVERLQPRTSEVACRRSVGLLHGAVEFREQTEPHVRDPRDDEAPVGLRALARDEPPLLEAVKQARDVGFARHHPPADLPAGKPLFAGAAQDPQGVVLRRGQVGALQDPGEVRAHVLGRAREVEEDFLL